MPAMSCSGILVLTLKRSHMLLSTRVPPSLQRKLPPGMFTPRHSGNPTFFYGTLGKVFLLCHSHLLALWDLTISLVGHQPLILASAEGRLPLDDLQFSSCGSFIVAKPTGSAEYKIIPVPEVDSFLSASPFSVDDANPPSGPMTASQTVGIEADSRSRQLTITNQREFGPDMLPNAGVVSLNNSSLSLSWGGGPGISTNLINLPPFGGLGGTTQRVDLPRAAGEAIKIHIDVPPRETNYLSSKIAPPMFVERDPTFVAIPVQYSVRALGAQVEEVGLVPSSQAARRKRQMSRDKPPGTDVAVLEDHGPKKQKGLDYNPTI